MTYRITFHNNELLVANEYIDVAFPAGTGIAHLLAANVTVFLMVPATGLYTEVVPITGIILGPTRTVRVLLGAPIEKSRMVRVWIAGVTNPKSCDYFLQVGTSNTSPQDSGTYTIFTAKVTLTPGKNLISLPAYPADTSIEVVLATLFVEVGEIQSDGKPFSFSVWYWDSWEQEWVIYASDTSFNDLTTMEAGKAYWIKVSHSIVFKFKGDPYPKSQGPPQKWCYPPSWSMIGPAIQTVAVNASYYLRHAMLPWPSQNTYAVNTILAFSPGTQQFINTSWNPGQANDPAWMGVYPAPVWPAKADYELVQMRGYFMSFLGEACIVPPIG